MVGPAGIAPASSRFGGGRSSLELRAESHKEIRSALRLPLSPGFKPGPAQAKCAGESRLPLARLLICLCVLHVQAILSSDVNEEVDSAGVEPAASRFVAARSILLSFESMRCKDQGLKQEAPPRLVPGRGFLVSGWRSTPGAPRARDR